MDQDTHQTIMILLEEPEQVEQLATWQINELIDDLPDMYDGTDLDKMLREEIQTREAE